MSHKSVDERQCDWCRHVYPADLVVGIEDTQERLCVGCYYCWKHTAPMLERDFRHMEARER